jgi:hypothetical protein
MDHLKKDLYLWIIVTSSRPEGGCAKAEELQSFTSE